MGGDRCACSFSGRNKFGSANSWQAAEQGDHHHDDHVHVHLPHGGASLGHHLRAGGGLHHSRPGTVEDWFWFLGTRIFSEFLIVPVVERLDVFFAAEYWFSCLKDMMVSLSN